MAKQTIFAVDDEVFWHREQEISNDEDDVLLSLDEVWRESLEAWCWLSGLLSGGVEDIVGGLAASSSGTRTLEVLCRRGNIWM